MVEPKRYRLAVETSHGDRLALEPKLVAENEGLVTADETALMISVGVASMVVSRVAMALALRSRAGESALRPLARLMRTAAIDESTAQPDPVGVTVRTSSERRSRDS
jgi:hypothetical protein